MIPALHYHVAFLVVGLRKGGSMLPPRTTALRCAQSRKAMIISCNRAPRNASTTGLRPLAGGCGPRYNHERAGVPLDTVDPTIHRKTP